MLTKTQPTSQRMSIFEHVTTGGRIDREAGVIRGVKILGKISKNRREYTQAALEEAAGHYSGIKVNLNHPSAQEIKKSRGVESWIGTLENIAIHADGVYGDLHLLRSHPYTPVIIEAAERHPGKFGLSHNADCSGFNARGKAVIESVEKVRSVDLVSSPATTGGLFESMATLEMDGMADMGVIPSMGPTDSETDGDATLADIQDVINDTSLTADEQIAAITAILSGVTAETGAVQESYSGRSGARSALAFTDAKSFAESVRGPSLRPRPSARKSTQSFSFLEQVESHSGVKSALSFHDAKSLAALVR